VMEFIFVGIGGFIGSCLRFGFNKTSNYFCLSFPFGTLFSNVIAGLAVGFIIGLEHQSFVISPKTKSFFTTGLLGGLSTFSTFSMETVNMFGEGRYIAASGNIILNLGLSLLFVVIGMSLARVLLKAD